MEKAHILIAKEIHAWERKEDMATKRVKAKAAKKSEGSRSLLGAVGTGVLAGSLIWVILLIGLSFLIVRSGVPEKLILRCVFLLAACAAVSAGAVCTRLAKAGILVPGLVAGILLLAVVWALSLALASGESGAVSVPLKLLLCAEFPFFSLIGAKLASGKRRSVRRPVRS